MIRRNVVVRGDVQGVFFRDSCRRAALDLGVAGWVQNNYNGTVEAVFEGPEDAVEAMVTWCRQGPPHATVEGVDVTTEEPQQESGFALR